MRKFTKFMAALALLLFMTPAMVGWGQTKDDVVYKTALFGSSYNSQGVSSYTGNSWYSTTNGFRLDIVNANNNNNGWSYIKIGGKNGAYTGTLTTNAAIDEAVTKVDLTIDAITAANVTSMTLYTSSNGSTWTNAGTFDKSTGVKTVALSNPTAALYYKIEVVCTKGSSNGLVTISKVEYYHSNGGTSVDTWNVTYHANGGTGDDVVVTYNEGDDVTVAANTFTNPGYDFTEWNTEADGTGDSYSPGDVIEGIDDDIELYAQWEEIGQNTDVLNYDFTGINGTSYAEWTNTSTLGTVYVGQSGGQYSSIQLRSNNNNSGIVTTFSVGNVTKVVVNWNTNTETGRTLNVYGKNTPYSAVTNLYNDELQGELLGTIVKGTSTELIVTGNYAFIGLRSASGAMYLDEIRITWEVSEDPTCAVSPDTHDFGNVVIGNTATQSFTVNTANLTGALTLSMSNSAYTVAPTTIEQNASTTQVTITFAPTSAGEFDAFLVVNGSGFTDEEVALVSGIGASERTITLNAGTGTCASQTLTGADGASITLPVATPSTACAAAGWTFAGWSTSNVEETTIAPSLISGEYTINGDATLYAVYSLIEAGSTQNIEFNFGNIAEANNWENGIAYTPVVIEPITITANGGGNNAKYYTSDKTWRMYTGGSVTIATTSGAITAVTSNPDTEFTINTDGTASQSFTATVKFKSITVSYGSTTVNYATSPLCLEPVATPTFNPEDGTIFYEDELDVTISCTTENATIHYTVDGSDPTNESPIYDGAITLAGTTTIKAIAVKEGMANSEIAEALYTHVSMSTIAEVRALETGSSVITKGVVTHMSGVTAYIQDETAAIVVYGSDVPAVGDEIRVSGTLTSYKGLLEIGSSNNPPTINVLSQNNTIEPTVMTIEAINTDAAGNNAYQAKLVRIENATYNNGTVSQGGNSITVYGTMAGVNDGNIVSFTGNIGCYNSVQIVNPTDIIVSHTLTITGYGTSTGGYYLIASPVTVDPATVDGMTEGDYDLYYFDQTEEKEWQNYKDTDGTGHFNLVPGKGYLYAHKTGGQFTLTGTPYSGDGKVTLNKTNDTNADFQGWNLVGNPYAEIAHITTQEGHALNFYTLTSAGDEFEAATNTSVQSMEGVFVVAQEDGEEITFTKGEGAKGSLVALNLSNGRNIIDRAIVRFNECRQLPKIQLNPNHTKVYISQDGQDYAMVRAEEMGEMPVSFKAENNGTYTLSLSSENVEFAYLHLIDNITGTDVDLLQTPSYSFEAKTNDYESRFKLVFATGDNSNDDTFAFYSNGSFVINNEGNAELQVIDIMGRIVKSESINGCANVNVNGTTGVYMLRLVNGDNVKVQKVVVK